MGLLSVLHIEDDRGLRTLVKHMLTKEPPLASQVLEAESLAQGLEIIAAHKLDLIILDLNLPDCSRLETLTAVRTAAPQTAIVVLTGLQDDEISEQILAHGAQEYLSKSELKPRVFARVIRYALERKQTEVLLDRQQVELAEEVVRATGELLEANQLLKNEIRERQRAEDALKQREAHYRILTESLSDVIWTSDLQLHFKYISPAVKTLLGYEPQEVLALRRKDVLTPASLSAAFEVIHRELARAASGQGPVGSLFILDLELKRKDGTTVWTEARATFLRNAAGQPHELLVVTRDVTEARRTQLELQRNYGIQRLLNSLLSISLDDDPKDEFLAKALNLLLDVPWLTLESKGAIFLVEDDPEVLVMKAHGGLSKSVLEACSRVAFGSCLCGRAAVLGHTVFAGTIDSRHETTFEGMVPHGHYCIPMSVGGQVLGIINLYLPDGHVPKEGESDFLTTYANVLAGVIARRRAEKTLRSRETRISAFFELLPDPVVVYDMEGKALIVNTAFEKTFGWSRQEVLNTKISFVPSETLPETIVALERIKKGEGVKDFQTKRLTKDGRTLDVIINTAPYFEQGRQSGNMVVLRDMSELTAAEKALRTSEVRYKTLVETIREGIITIDAEKIVTYANQSLATMLGYSLEEIIGQDVMRFYDKEGRAALEREWGSRQEGGDQPYEASLQKKDGGRVFVMVYPRPLFSEYGHLIGATALVTDITQRKILESQLLQAQKLESIGQLAAGIAHEINTPTQYVSDNTRFLNDAFLDVTRAVGGYLNLGRLIRERAGADPEVERALEQAEATYQEIDGDYLLEEVPKAIEQTLEGLNRIATIVRSMKEFAHPGPDKKTPTDINRAIENTITVAKNEWKYVAEVVTELDPALPMVPCVPGELNQVFLNIIVNAAHAIADVVKEAQGSKGQIKISTRQMGDDVEIRIIDTGPGIPEELISRVFDPFFTTKPPGKGTGQGLAIAYRVVMDKHGGHLSVENLPGQGACFVIRLPLKESGRESQGQ